MEDTAPGMEGKDRKPIQATVLGVGAVGGHAVQAASRYGDLNLWSHLAMHGVPGVHVNAVDYDVVNQEESMREILSRTDIIDVVGTFFKLKKRFKLVFNFFYFRPYL